MLSDSGKHVLFGITGAVVGIWLYSLAVPKPVINVPKRIQFVYGRAADTNLIACTIVPNPWPGHSNIFFITNLNVGVLQLEFKMPYEETIKFIHRELSNPPVVESGMPVYK